MAFDECRSQPRVQRPYSHTLADTSQTSQTSVLRGELRVKLLTWLDSIALCAAADTDECVYDDGVANVEEAAA